MYSAMYFHLNQDLQEFPLPAPLLPFFNSLSNGRRWNLMYLRFLNIKKGEREYSKKPAYVYYYFVYCSQVNIHAVLRVKTCNHE